MSFIKQAYNGKTDWWRYGLGLLIIFFFWQVLGAIPFLGAIIMKSIEAGTLDESIFVDQALLMKIFSPNKTLFLMLIMFVFGLVGVFVAVKYVHHLTLTQVTTSRKKIDWSRVFFSFFTWGILTTIITLVGYYISPEEYIVNFNMNKFLMLLLIATLLLPLQTSFEEYLFRGYLMQGLGVISKTRWFPLLTTSVVFGLMHLANPEVDKLGSIVMVYYIGTGLLLGIFTLMDEGIELSLGFHAANNLFTALLVTADWTAMQTESILIDTSEPAIGFDVFIPVLIIYPIIIFLFAKKYKWVNWKENLLGSI